MRPLYLAVIIFCFTSVSFAQLQLAPNAACANNTPYCRAQVSPVPGTQSVPAIIGFHAGVLYGSITVQAGDSCPGTATHTTSPGTLCFYSTNSFAPENWGYLDQFSTQDVPNAIEVVFAPGSCSNKYVYTTGQHLLMATNSPTDWHFTEIIQNLGVLPGDMSARPGSFAAANQPSGTRLFYAKYSNGSINPCPNPVPPAYIWYSDNCGSTWANSQANSPTDPVAPNSFGGREVHAINVDPANSLIIYANVDTECAKTATSLGLWKSVDGGNTFNHVYNSSDPTNLNLIGIDFVVPKAANKLFMEVDNGHTDMGPLLSWDKLNGANNPRVPALWPNIQGEPAWSTAFGNSINLTSEQNIFVVSLADPTQNPPIYRAGAWYLAPPFYDVAVRLEDFAPPINTANISNGTATITTFEEHHIQAGDTVSIQAVSQPAFNTSNLTPTLLSDTQFSYPCSSCTVSGNGGFASKNLEFQNRTVEVVGPPPQNTVYLYSQRLRMVKPHFITPPLPAAGSALTTFVDLSGGQHWIYEGTNQHLYNLFWTTTTGISFTDITTTAGAPVAATSTALSSYVDSAGGQHVIFEGTNQHVYQAVWYPTGSYGYEDRTAATGAPVAAASSRLSNYVDSAGGQHFLFEGTNQHIYQAYWIPNGGFGYEDRTAVTGAPVAAMGSALDNFLDSNGGQHFLFVGTNQHVYQAYWLPNSGFGYEDRTAATGAPIAVAGSALSSYVDSNGGQHTIFLGTNQHVYQAFWIPNNGFGYEDRTAATGAPVAAAGSALSNYLDSNGGQHFAYLGTNQHAYQAYWIPNSGFGYEDRTAATSAPIAASGSALSTFLDPSGGQHFVYLGTDQHVNQANWIPNAGFGFTDLHAR